MYSSTLLARGATWSMSVWQSTCWPEFAQKRPSSSVLAPLAREVHRDLVADELAAEREDVGRGVRARRVRDREMPDVERLEALELELDVVQAGVRARARRPFARS